MQSSKGCVRLRDALKCIGMRLGSYLYSRVKPLEESNCNVHYAMNYVDSPWTPCKILLLLLYLQDWPNCFNAWFGLEHCCSKHDYSSNLAM